MTTSSIPLSSIPPSTIPQSTSSTFSTTFTFPNALLERLGRLHLAADESADSVLHHIHLQVTAHRVCFAATNGRLLAVVQCSVTDLIGPAREVVLDAKQLTAAIRLLSTAIPARSLTPIPVTITDTEVRFSVLSSAALIRIVPGRFPDYSHVLSQTEGQHWVPTASTLSPHLVAIAQRIVGKLAVLFSSAVNPASSIARAWASLTPDEVMAPISSSDFHALVRLPGYWTDGTLALLVMPLPRQKAERQLEFSDFIAPLTTPPMAAPPVVEGSDDQVPVEQQAAA